MRLGVIIPHKDREEFKNFQELYLTQYLESQGLEHKVFFCEQRDDQMFSRAASLNVGFKFCWEDYRPDYVVVGDVDMVPLNVDYEWGGVAEAWFINAGGFKLLAADFIAANGYNNNFRGWGHEDSEFWLRLGSVGVKNTKWRPSYKAEVVDLEMKCSDSEAKSVWYFGNKTNVRFYRSDEAEVTREVVSSVKKTWYSDQGSLANKEMLERIRAMPRDKRSSFFSKNGLNSIDPEKIRVASNSTRVANLYFDSSDYGYWPYKKVI
jgi:hypothetical protein